MYIHIRIYIYTSYFIISYHTMYTDQYIYIYSYIYLYVHRYWGRLFWIFVEHCKSILNTNFIRFPLQLPNSQYGRTAGQFFASLPYPGDFRLA